MKTIRLTAALLLALPLGATAQQEFQAPALLIDEGGAVDRAWIIASTKTSIRYRETPVAVDTTDAKIADYQSIYLFEPPDYTQAMDLYQARRYADAKAKFAEVQERYKPVYPLENSPGALAAFYEMECLRKLGDLEGLSAALQKFDKDPLTRETQLRQLELYVLWDAARTKSWESLEKLAKEREETRMPGEQRAQVAYCQGLALENLQRPDEAILAYQTAMTADAGASDEVAREAAIKVMGILTGDPEVKRAIREWDNPAVSKAGAGYAKLVQAAAVAELYQMTLGAGAPLPKEFQDLPKYKPKEEPKAAPEEEKADETAAKPDGKADPKDASKKPDPKKPDAKKSEPKKQEAAKKPQPQKKQEKK